jgi:uncharacterized protein
MTSIPLSTTTTQDRVLRRLAQEFDSPDTSIATLVELLDSGWGIPYLSRYKSRETGGIAEQRMYELRQRVAEVRMLEEHKTVILETAERAGWLDDDVTSAVLAFTGLDRLEDYWQTLKRRKNGPAAMARANGLGPLADALRERKLKEGQSPLELAEGFVDEARGVPDARTALDGARTILGEEVQVTKQLRDALWNVQLRAVPHKTGKSLPKPLASLAGFAKPARQVQWHDLLRLKKAAREGYLQLDFSLSEERAHQVLSQQIPGELGATDPLRGFWDSTMRQAWLDLLKEPCEREVMRELKERSDRTALRTFAQRFGDLLLDTAVGARRTCGVLPAIRKTTRLAVVDENGALVAHTSCQALKEDKKAENQERLRTFLAEHAVEVLALGSGPGCREVEALLLETLQGVEGRPQMITVNEDGTLGLAKRKAGKQDIATQKARLLARRAQNPLNEWIRVDTAELPIGYETTEVHQGLLLKSLEDVREASLHRVGVDLQTANEDLLAVVCGIDRAAAGKIVKARTAGQVTSRQALRDLDILDENAFAQAAPFLIHRGSTNALDRTRIPPLHYTTVEGMAASIGLTVAQLLEQPGQITKIKLDAFHSDTIDADTVQAILAELREPFADPRRPFENVAFNARLKTLEDLEMGMDISGRVTRIADFGAFVDIGVAPGGLLHVSQMSERYVGDPSRIVSVGQVVRVRVLEVDRKAGRLSLTMRRGDIRKVQRTLGDMADGKRRPSAVVVPHGAEETGSEVRLRAAAKPSAGGRGGRGGPGGGRGGPGGGRGGPGGGRGGPGGRGDRSDFRRRDGDGPRGRGPVVVESDDIKEVEKQSRGLKGELKSFAALASMLGGEDDAKKGSGKKDKTPTPAPEPTPAVPPVAPTTSEETPTPADAPPADAPAPDAPAPDAPAPDTPPAEPKPFGEDFV